MQELEIRILKLLDGNHRYEDVRPIAAAVGASVQDTLKSVRRLVEAGHICVEETQYQQNRLPGNN